MNTQKRSFVLVLSLLAAGLLLAALPVWAQTNTNPSGNPEVKYGVYDVYQTVEFGGKIVDTSGNPGMWSTLVNQQSGGRLISETFDMHAAGHNGILFDDLSLNTFGFGDPNNVGTVKIQKGKWYSFRGNFRRDKTFFDYDLLANTMNPPSTAPNVGYTISPHMFAQTRKLQDYNLELFPVSRFKVRLGYAYENTEGRRFLSSHFGTEPVYTTNIRGTNNTYRAGLTFKVVQGTSITFDHTFSHYKNDSASYDQNQLFTLNGRPIDMGLPWAGAPFNAPCAAPITSTGTVNPVCNGYFAYTQFLPVRSNFPTDSFGFTSIYKKLNQTGRVFYSGGESITPNYRELLDGLTTRTNTRITNSNGNMFATRVAAGAEYAATFEINSHFRLLESFRWEASRIPSTFFSNESLLTGASLAVTPNVFSPATCPSPYTAATCPQHTTSTGADLSTSYDYRFEGEDLKTNLVSVEFDANRHFGGHAGFRYDAKTITLRSGNWSALTYYPGAATASAAKTSARNAACVGGAVDATGVCRLITTAADGESFNPNTKGPIFGFWVRPTDKLRASFDMEAMFTDHPWLVIAPKTFQLYRVKSSYRPNEKFAFLFGMNLLQRNNDEAVNNKQHTRSFSFDGTYNPNEKFGADLSYQYTGIASDSYMCYWANPNVLGSTACAANPVNQYYQATSLYRNDSHFGSMSFTFQPVPRLRAAVGYAATQTSGNALLTSQYMSLGPLDSIYHMPQASFEFDLNKVWTWKTAWNYYGYEEGSYQMPGVTLPRNVRGNIFTLSLKYKIGQAR